MFSIYISNQYNAFGCIGLVKKDIGISNTWSFEWMLFLYLQFQWKTSGLITARSQHIPSSQYPARDFRSTGIVGVSCFGSSSFYQRCWALSSVSAIITTPKLPPATTRNCLQQPHLPRTCEPTFATLGKHFSRRNFWTFFTNKLTATAFALLLYMRLPVWMCSTNEMMRSPTVDMCSPNEIRLRTAMK